MTRFRDDTASLYRDYANLFFDALKSGSFKTETDIHRHLLGSPAPSWYCSPENALRMIAKQRRFGNRLKEIKYNSLAEVVRHRQRLNPDVCRIDILYEVVFSPAPAFFISLSTAKRIILKYRKSKRFHYERFKIPTRRD